MTSIDYILGVIVYIIFLIYSGILFIITITSLMRNYRSRLNQIFAGFFLTMSTSSILLFYILFRDPTLSELATLLAKSMFYIGAILSAGLLFLYTLILLKYKIMSKLTNIVIFLTLYIGSTFGMLLIPDGVIIEVVSDTIVNTTWSFGYFLYFLTTLLIMTFLTLYLSFKILKQFKNRDLRRRFSYNIGGMGLFYSYPIFTSILVFFKFSFFIYTIIIIFGSFLGIGFIYYGLAKTLET